MKRAHPQATLVLRGSGRPQPRSGAGYSVGYGKPPKQHRFQPGQSGNRKAAQRARRTPLTLLREILDRKVEIRSGSTVRKISVREAILTRFAESALKGDTKSAGFLLQRYDMAETGTSMRTDVTTQEEQEIIDAYMQGTSEGKR